MEKKKCDVALPLSVSLSLFLATALPSARFSSCSRAVSDLLTLSRRGEMRRSRAFERANEVWDLFERAGATSIDKEGGAPWVLFFFNLLFFAFFLLGCRCP